MPSPAPHPLDLYRLSVQHPLAEVAFVEHAWAHHHGDGCDPMLLREDFAGTCAVAAAWCASDPDRQAMAIELDPATAGWAAQQFADVDDLHIVEADVMDIDQPAVDVILALNFSVLIYHDADSLRAYLNNALRSLNPGGLLILDLFGGPGIDRPSVQAVDVDPDEAGVEPFTYRWEQRGLDPATRRIDCRVHFDLADGTRQDDAFLYDWRLWRPGELIDTARSAGFAQAELWWADPSRPGRFAPVAGEPDAEAWVAYVVCMARDDGVAQVGWASSPPSGRRPE